jgi:hypothetical protein
MTLTPEQQRALGIIRTLNEQQFTGWFNPADVMAIIEIESGFREAVHSADGLGSIGLMQVLPATAQSMGIDGDQADPEISILTGMRYLAYGWQYLENRLGRPPMQSEWFAGYNEGYGAAARGRRDDAYSEKAIAARTRWLEVLQNEADPTIGGAAAADAPAAGKAAAEGASATSQATSAQPPTPEHPMPLSMLFGLLPTLLHLASTMPELIADIEKFWSTISSNPLMPGHMSAAFEAGIAAVKAAGASVDQSSQPQQQA